MAEEVVIPEEDQEFIHWTIEGSKPVDGGFALDIRRPDQEPGDGSMGIVIQNTLGAEVVPKQGDTLRLYGKGVGYPIRGATVNGVPLCYRTEEQDKAARLAALEEEDRRKREAFEAERESMDARFDALPEPFQRRIARRRRNNPDFRWKYEGYEMFVCEEAVKFASAAKAAEANTDLRLEVASFWGDTDRRRAASMEADPPQDFYSQFMGYAYALGSPAYGYDHEAQARLLGVSDQHSGNTFGMAMRLALLYVTGDEEGVDRQYGALSPLVGSEDYGDIDPPAEGMERCDHCGHDFPEPLAETHSEADCAAIQEEHEDDA